MDHLIEIVTELHQRKEPTIQRDGWHIQRDGWHIRQGGEGANGLVYRAQHGDEPPLAVKLSRMDARKRGEREYKALRALHHTGITPKPLELISLPDMTILISMWCEGSALPPPPYDDHSWHHILDSLATAHHLTPQQTPIEVPPAVIYVRQPSDLWAYVYHRLASIDQSIPAPGITPDEAQKMLPHTTPEQWPNDAPCGLIMCDPNPNNMLYDGQSIRLVDWENSGWSDPAYEVADLCAHDQFRGLSDERRTWIKHQMADRLNDPHLVERATTYERIMWWWWLVSSILYLRRPKQNIAGKHPFSTAYLLEQQAYYHAWLQL